MLMTGAKLIVLYPMPTDVAAFERAYLEEHVPLARAKIVGKTKLIFTRIVGAPGGGPAFHRMAEIHFPSTEKMQESLSAPSTQEVAAHAVSISSGGAPIFMVGEEKTITF
jgi:uncharacterized protein (TIGR02118 family)